MPLVTPLPAHLRARVFTVAEARALGISASRLRGPELRRPFHGIRSSVDDTTLEARCRALQAAMRPKQFFSHNTAAMLHGIPLPLRLQNDRMLHVSAFRPGAPPRRAGVVGHRLAPLATKGTTVSGLRVASPVHAWCMLAELLTVPDIVAAADFLVSGKFPRTSIPALKRAAEAWRGRPGAGRLLEALPQVRAEVRSRQETHTRLVVVAAGLPEPELNASIYTPGGRFLAMPDLLWRAKKVGAEYEGDYHRSDQQQFRRDITRRERVEDYGWRLTRFTSDDVRHGTAEFVRRIASRLGIELDAAAVARAVTLAGTLEP